MAVLASPTTARTVATVQAAHPAAAILANRFGEGTAYLLTASDGLNEGAGADSLWNGVARLAAGEPTARLSAEDSRRYRLILTRISAGHVLHVIDSQADLPGAPLRPVSISLSSARLGNPARASLIGSIGPLELCASPAGSPCCSSPIRRRVSSSSSRWSCSRASGTISASATDERAGDSKPSRGTIPMRNDFRRLLAACLTILIVNCLTHARAAEPGADSGRGDGR